MIGELRAWNLSVVTMERVLARVVRWPARQGRGDVIGQLDTMDRVVAILATRKSSNVECRCYVTLNHKICQHLTR
jgi:hypothetical protein